MSGAPPHRESIEQSRGEPIPLSTSRSGHIDSESDRMDVDGVFDELDKMSDMSDMFDFTVDDSSAINITDTNPRANPPPAYTDVHEHRSREDRNMEMAMNRSLANPALSERRDIQQQNAWRDSGLPNGFSSASANAAREESSRSSNRPVAGSSWNNGPPQADISTSRPVQSNMLIMCVVCTQKPVHKNFPTCGNTCGKLLEEAKRNVPQSLPLENASQRPSYSGATTRGSNRTPSSAAPISMCRVCNLRPIYEKNGKRFPTCGLTCASKIPTPPKSIPMCEYCHQRPKVVLNDKVFPHCGRTCRDSARHAGGAHSYPVKESVGVGMKISSPTLRASGSCTTCLFCWSAPRRSHSDDFCSDMCRDIVAGHSPFIIEVPRGHASFQTVEKTCVENWNTNAGVYPNIKRVYMIQPKAGFSATFSAYQSQLSSAKQNGRPENKEQKHWIAASRSCSLGDAGCNRPCDSPQCMLCSIITTSVTRGNSPKGITTTSSLERAVDIQSNAQAKGHGSFLLLSDVLLGKVCDKSKNELMGPLPPPGSDSVRLVEYGLIYGNKGYYGEHLVYESKAIKPLYLIFYE